ncbi:MAG: hypothetical protein WC248_07880 [Candidatus Methanomethylophilaceae archaeon]|jgi:hypothetical protein
MSEIIVVALVTATASIITSIINKFGTKKFLDHIAEGLKLGLENDIVIFQAFRRNAINGESEAQEKKMNDYFRDTTTSSFFRKEKDGQ